MVNFKSLILLASTLLFHCLLWAESSLKFGELSGEEIQLSDCSFEKEAPAVYLMYNGEIKLKQSKVFIKKHIRVKVLNNNGIKYADVRLPYFTKNGYEKISDIRAQTINLNEGGELIYSEVKDHHIYTVDISADWKELRFAFPNVRTGSILEYEYTVSSDNLLYLDEWDFQQDLPIIHSELHVLIPTSLKYQVMLQGNRLLKKYRDLLTNFWELENVPSAKDEPFLYNKKDYTEKIQFQLMGYHKLHDHEGMVYKSLLSSWEDLADEVLNSYAFRSYLNKTSLAKNILSEMDLKGKNQHEKLISIYNYVIKHFRWTGKYRRYTYQKFTDFYESKVGHSSEINLFLTLLLNEAGIESYPVLISTRSNGEYLKEHPFLSQFNHLGVQAIIDDRQLFLDATDNFRPYFLPDIEEINKEGYVLNKRKPEWWMLPIPEIPTMSFLVEVQMEEKGNISAEVDLVSKDYFALDNRKNIFKNGNEKWVNGIFGEYVFEDRGKLLIENLHEINKPLEAKIYLELAQKNNKVQKGNVHYRPFILSILKENPFNNNERNFPIQLPYMSKLNYDVKIKVPDNYKILYIPNSERIILPNELGEFKYKSSVKNGEILIGLSLEIKTMELPASQYGNIREFYSLVVSKLNSEIVFEIK